MGDFLSKVKDWWANAEGSHRAFAIGGAALFGVILIAVFMFAGRPHMALLFSGLPAAEQGNVVGELEKAGIKTEGNEHGDVLVVNDRLAEARMKLAVAGKLPASGGFTDFDKEISAIGLMNTPPVEKERLKGILENKIAESIQSIEGISAARVHIVLAEDKAFISEAKPATASITITQAANATISKDQGKAIATLTANSVPGLTLANVAVLNNRMEMLFDGHDLETTSGTSNERFATEDMESRKFADSLQRRLDQAYGPGAVLVSVHMQLDFDKIDSVTDAVTPTDPVAIEKNSEKMEGKKPVVGGASGAISNTASGQPAAPASATTTDSSYTNTSTKLQPGATNTHVVKNEAPGTVKAMGINVIANSDKITDPAPLNDIIDGELGPKASDPNFTRKVTLIKFDTSAAKAEAAAASAAAGNARMQQIISMIPMVALIAVGFFVLRQVIKITRPAPVEIEPISSIASSALPAGATPINPDLAGVEISAEALMEANGGVLPQGISVNPNTGLVVLDGTENLSDEDRLRIVRGISAKVNVPLEQIKRMCQDRPEAVAMLIKGWLLEEKKG